MNCFLIIGDMVIDIPITEQELDFLLALDNQELFVLRTGLDTAIQKIIEHIKLKRRS